jgi:hypothetical protein
MEVLFLLIALAVAGVAVHKILQAVSLLGEVIETNAEDVIEKLDSLLDKGSEDWMKANPELKLTEFKSNGMKIVCVDDYSSIIDDFPQVPETEETDLPFKLEEPEHPCHDCFHSIDLLPNINSETCDHCDLIVQYEVLENKKQKLTFAGSNKISPIDVTTKSDGNPKYLKCAGCLYSDNSEPKKCESCPI